MYAERDLAKLGYHYVAGGSGNQSDLVLRQTHDSSKGFEWKGQADYDALGDAVVACVQGQLTSLCGLEALPLPRSLAGAEAHSAVYASPGFEMHEGPLLMLVCGSAPGGAAGIWGRSLCINASLLQGAMFDHIFRAQRLGWAVLVANPNVNAVAGVPITGSECHHLHLQTLWRDYVAASKASKVLVVAHSYGAPATVHLLKTEAVAVERIHAIAFTDGGGFTPGALLCEVVPPDDAEASKPLREMLTRVATLAPAAFQPPPERVIRRLAEVGRNFVASKLPAGTPIASVYEGTPAVSAGHEQHPSTTFTATEVVFAFLQQGVEGMAGTSNEELVGRCGC